MNARRSLIWVFYIIAWTVGSTLGLRYVPAILSIFGENWAFVFVSVFLRLYPLINIPLFAFIGAWIYKKSRKDISMIRVATILSAFMLIGFWIFITSFFLMPFLP